MKHQLTITWQHIRRSPYQAATAIMIMTLTIFVGLSFVLLSLGSQKTLLYLEQRPQVIAFFNDSITNEDHVKDLEKQVKDTGKIAAIKFVTKDEALKTYRKIVNNEPLLTELVTASTLPTDLEFSAKNISDVPALYKILSKAQNIEEIRYNPDVISNMIRIVDWVRKFGVALVSFLLITTLLIILTIIGMKISLRREEIEVERLVGASKWYIRFPFLFEGFLYGALGALLSWSTIYLLLYLLTPHLQPYLSGLSILPVPTVLMLELLGGTVLCGGLVGILGSFIAVWRFLRD